MSMKLLNFLASDLFMIIFNYISELCRLVTSMVWAYHLAFFEEAGDAVISG